MREQSDNKFDVERVIFSYSGEVISSLRCSVSYKYLKMWGAVQDRAVVAAMERDELTHSKDGM